VRIKADRIDLLADGTLRVIDYKLSKAPKAARALQLPVYGICADSTSRAGTADLDARRRVRGVPREERLHPSADPRRSTSRRGGQVRLDTLDAIERGEFPPQPDEPFLCTRCGFATVCRKDYVGDE
jgi:hypothetical protein